MGNGYGSGSDVIDGEWQVKLHSPTSLTPHLLLLFGWRGRPNRLQTGPQPRD